MTVTGCTCAEVGLIWIDMINNMCQYCASHGCIKGMEQMTACWLLYWNYIFAGGFAHKCQQVNDQYYDYIFVYHVQTFVLLFTTSVHNRSKKLLFVLSHASYYSLEWTNIIKIMLIKYNTHSFVIEFIIHIINFFVIYCLIKFWYLCSIANNNHNFVLIKLKYKAKQLKGETIKNIIIIITV